MYPINKSFKPLKIKVHTLRWMTRPQESLPPAMCQTIRPANQVLSGKPNHNWNLPHKLDRKPASEHFSIKVIVLLLTPSVEHFWNQHNIF